MKTGLRQVVGGMDIFLLSMLIDSDGARYKNAGAFFDQEWLTKVQRRL